MKYGFGDASSWLPPSQAQRGYPQPQTKNSKQKSTHWFGAFTRLVDCGAVSCKCVCHKLASPPAMFASCSEKPRLARARPEAELIGFTGWFSPPYSGHFLDFKQSIRGHSFVLGCVFAFLLFSLLLSHYTIPNRTLRRARILARPNPNLPVVGLPSW